MGDWRVHFPVIGADYDDEGRPKTRPCTDLLTIKNGFDKLSLVPLKASGVHITGFTETENEFPAPDEYRVNYVTGRVYFNQANEGQTCTAVYDGIGTLVGVDEINWLWEKTAAYADFEYYTALHDTPSILIPRAVQVADKDADKITQMSPYIGRSYCDSFLLPDWKGAFKFQGTIFDAITAYQIELGLQDPEIVNFENGVIDNLATNGTVFVGGTGGGYLWSTVSLNSIGKRSVGHVALENNSGNVRLLFSIERVYHKWNGEEWEVVGDFGTAQELDTEEWNTPAQISSIPITGLQYLLNKNISIAVYAAEGASFVPELSVSIMNAEVFTQKDANTTFSIKEQEWTVELNQKANWVIIRGSGRDDVWCGSEVIEFKDVNPNEIVSVKAPVRTNVNVLFSGTRGEDKVYFPPEYRSWQPFFNDKNHPIDRKVLPHLCYPTLYTEYDRDEIFSSLTQAQKNLTVAYDLRLGKWENYISALNYPNEYKAKNYTPGNVSPAICVGPANCYARMLPYAQIFPWASYGGSSPVPVYANKCIGFLFKVTQQPVTILSYQLSGTSAKRFAINVKNNYLYLRTWGQTRDDLVGANYDTDKIIGSIRPGQWNSFILYSLGTTSTSTPDATMYWTVRLWFILNGESKWTYLYQDGARVSGSGWQNNVTGVWFPFPNTIGPDPVCEFAHQNTGKAFICMPFAGQFNMSEAQAQNISVKMLALGAENRPPSASTAKSATEALFMDGMNVADYATMSLPDGWQYVPNEPLFAFWNSKQLLTIKRNTTQVIPLAVDCEYDEVRGTCADITTLRMNAPLLASGYFANYQLVCITKDEGRYKQLYGPPGQLIASGTQIYNEWELVNNNKALVRYIDGEWKVKNLTSNVCDVRVAILGGSVLTSSANGNLGGGLGTGAGEELGDNWFPVKKFIDLLDAPASLLDSYPKALVSYKGMVQKMPYIHPFLLRHL